MLNKLLTKGKALFLAYDQGLEHGPSDFNDKNIDPQYIVDIAEEGKFNALIFQKGIAEKYYNKRKNKVPLILKLNGKTSLIKGDPFSPTLTTVKEAKKLGASAVGYTIYPGSIHEAKMFKEFEKIEREARTQNLTVIAWMYPRGKAVKNELDSKILAYSARIGLELGADIIKIKYNNNPKDLKWSVKVAGKTKVVISGGAKREPIELLKQTKDILNSGAIGWAIGRNIWQYKEPLKLTKALKSIIFQNKSVKEASKFLN
ncbi:MAG: fructose-bisphosphate aldolase [Nanoarchaeota archaeon]